MDASRSSHRTDPQPTQPVRSFLEQDPSTSRKSGDTHFSGSKSRNAQHDMTFDSFPSSRAPSSVPQYHFHGLASTQTQEQSQMYSEGDDANEGSQKENLNGSGSNEPTRSNVSPPSPPSSPMAKTIQKTSADRPKGGYLAHTKSPRKKTMSSVAFQSPMSKNTPGPSGPPVARETPFKATTSRYTSTRCSRSRSPDSFAGEEPPPRLFSSRKFDVPLSELIKNPTLDPSIDADSAIESTSFVMAPSLRPSRLAVNLGRTLVESTPSLSSLSDHSNEGPSQGLEPTQLIEDEPPITRHRQPTPTRRPPDDTDSDSDRRPSASYIRLLEGEVDHEPELVPTQPSTQPSDLPLGLGAGNSGTTDSSRPRTLMDTLPPEKRLRYQRYEQGAGDGGGNRDRPPPPPPKPQPTLPDYLMDSQDRTQPSNDETFTPVKPYSYQFPSRNASEASATRQHRPTPSRDAIIPDSEPPTSPIKKTFIAPRSAQRTPVSDRDGPMAVDQHSSDDDDEPEVPLAEVTKKPATRTKLTRAMKGKGKQGAEDPESPVEPGPAIKPGGARNRKVDNSWENTIIPSSIPEENGKEEKRVPPARMTRRQAAQPLTKAEATPIVKRKKPVSEDEAEEGKSATKKRSRTASGGAQPAPKRPKRVRAASQALKQHRPSATPSRNPDGTRVFALWKTDGHFYSGTLGEAVDSDRYHVYFDDKTQLLVEAQHIRRLELRVGDHVLPNNSNRAARVVYVDDDNEDVFQILIDDEPVVVHLNQVRIAFKTVQSAWGDRRLVSATVPPAITPRPSKAKVEPSPATVLRGSVPENGKIFGGLGVLLTLNAATNNKKRQDLTKAITTNGGVVLEDFTSVIDMEGKHEQQGCRWALEKKQIYWTGHGSIERILVIADEPNQKSKYLVALALGVPCVSTAWIENSIEKGEFLEWDAYLLPRGFSTVLGMRLAQQVDLDWGNSPEHLTDIISNPAPTKIFSHLDSVLCVGPDMVPQDTKKTRFGTDSKTKEAMSTVPRIILCMGARRVEAVKEIRHARSNHYDLIVVRDQAHCSSDFPSGVQVVDWAWVKDCLIAARLLSLPDWSIPCSQET